MKGQKEVQRIEAQRVHDIMALGLVPDTSGVAIDGGAHVGSWTIEMAKYFKEVRAFEPCKESFDMLVENVRAVSAENVVAYNEALMDKQCTVDVVRPRPKRQTLTARQVRRNGSEVRGVAIDSLELQGCDLIKLDLEGAEGLALRGAAETIRAHKPFLVIEFNGLAPQFGCTEMGIIQQLRTWGYAEVWRDGVDRGFACKQR